MRNGTCVKCGATTVRAARNGIKMGEGSQAALKPDIGPDFRGMVIPQPTDVTAFGCVTCGYVEFYVLDPAGVNYMAQNWPPVQPQGGAPPT